MLRFDYATVIGRDVQLFKWTIDQVLRNGAAGLTRDDWDFNTYIYYNEGISEDVTEELIYLCKTHGINYELHYENPSEPFISRLYKAWNRVQLMGKHPITIRGGSDQSFYAGSFREAIKYYEIQIAMLDGPCVVNFQTVESPLAGLSRHYILDAGSTPETYKEEIFIEFCDKIKMSGLWTIGNAMNRWDGKPGPFTSSLGHNHLRGDGVSWVLSKELFKKFSPMPALVNTPYGPITGDVIIHDRLEAAGIPSYIAGEAISYHLVAGESRERLV